MRGSLIRAAAALLLGVGLATCTDSSAPRALGRASLAIAPRFSPQATAVYQRLAAFGFKINKAHFVVRTTSTTDTRVPAPPKVLVEQTVDFPEAQTELAITLDVPMTEKEQLVQCVVELLDGTQLLFSGSQLVTARLTQTTTTDGPVSVNYVGPGANVALLVVTPDGQTVQAPNTLALSVQAFDANQGAVTNVPIDWTVSDATVATITNNGLNATLQPTGKRGPITITAVTPTGISDNATASILPAPGVITVVGGTAQSAIVGTTLTQPLSVRVDAADNLPSPGITVQFRSVTTGGSVTPASATTNASGIATTAMKLGNTPGQYTFEASVTGLTAKTVTATANPGAPAGVSKTAGDAQTAVVSTILPVQPAITVRDALNNPVPGLAVTFAPAQGSGVVSSGSGFVASVVVNTDAQGVAKVSWQIGPTAGPNQLNVSVPGFANIPFTASAISGPAARIVITSPSRDTVVNPGVKMSIGFGVRVFDAGVNGVDGVTITFTLLPLNQACTLVGATNNTLSVTSVDGGFANVTVQVDGPAALSSCGLSVQANNLQGLPLTGSPIGFKVLAMDPAVPPITWTGNVSSVWTDKANWLRSVVPVAANDVWIPGASIITNLAKLADDRVVSSLTTEVGGQLDLAAHTLTVSQDLNSQSGLITGGTLLLTGADASATGTVQSDVVVGDLGCSLKTRIHIPQFLIIQGSLLARCPVVVGNGLLSVTGPATFTDQGTLGLPVSGSAAQFLGDVTFGGPSNTLLADGVIAIAGNFKQVGLAGNFAPTLAVVTHFLGSDPQKPQTISFDDTRQSRFSQLLISNTAAGVQILPTNGGNLTVTQGLAVLGKLTVLAGATVSALSPISSVGLPSISLFSGSALTVGGSLTYQGFCVIHTLPPVPVVTVLTGGTWQGGCQQAP